jgi:hypothetical protein
MRSLTIGALGLSLLWLAASGCGGSEEDVDDSTRVAASMDQFQILVHYRSLVDNAYVEVWESDSCDLTYGNGAIRRDYGNTEDGGIFSTWLESSCKYRITVEKNDQVGEWNGFPANSKIHIYMHTSPSPSPRS